MVSAVSAEAKQKYLISVEKKVAKGVGKGKNFAPVLKLARNEIYIVEYWKGRTLLANGNVGGAKELLESLKIGVLNVIDNYHGQDRIYGLMAGAIMAHICENEGKNAALAYLDEAIVGITSAPGSGFASHNTNAIIALLEVASICGMKQEAGAKADEVLANSPFSHGMAMQKIGSAVPNELPAY